ncbi:alpha/beta hydrolase [Paraburkholderia sp. MM5477-R1]|uniref:alpha/beta hydrolase n=1 Tax=Paraburkholderia sp. MM5477-R1 TaxID=2991062 RepID=UPI003D258312
MRPLCLHPLFIRGFKVGFVDAARRTAQMAYDLGFDGAPVFFSWPSQGQFSPLAPLTPRPPATTCWATRTTAGGPLSDMFAGQPAVLPADVIAAGPSVLGVHEVTRARCGRSNAANSLAATRIMGGKSTKAPCVPGFAYA